MADVINIDRLIAESNNTVETVDDLKRFIRMDDEINRFMMLALHIRGKYDDAGRSIIYNIINGTIKTPEDKLSHKKVIENVLVKKSNTEVRAVVLPLIVKPDFVEVHLTDIDAGKRHIVRVKKDVSELIEVESIDYNFGPFTGGTPL